MSVCVSHTSRVPLKARGDIRAPGLESWAMVSCHMVRGTKPRSSIKAAHDHNHPASLNPYIYILVKAAFFFDSPPVITVIKAGPRYMEDTQQILFFRYLKGTFKLHSRAARLPAQQA